MRVLADSSPLITLAKTGNLHLLQSLYDFVTVTPEVFDEVTLAGAGLPGASVIIDCGWIRVQPAIQSESATAIERFGLGVGEYSLIVLGRETKADLLLIDDLKARRVARDNGLAVLGCVGILYDAWTRNLIPDLSATYRSLLVSGAYVERKLLEGILRRLGLSPL